MAKIHKPMQGIRIWENEKNKFTIFEAHYSADPDKRTAEWKENAKAGMPRRKWEQEYEISWTTFAGLPVYGDFNSQVHLSESKIKPQIGLPLLIGFDFGLSAACIIGQLQEDQLVALKEFTSVNMGARRFLSHVCPQLRILFPKWGSFKKDYLCFGDPSGAFRKDTDEGTCFQELDTAGFSPQAGPVAFEARRTGVEHFLARTTKKGPCMIINQQECPMLVKGFEGGYHYPEKAVEIEAATLSPVKNKYSHVHDAWQYLCCGMRDMNRPRRRGAVPTPSYGFQKR